MITNLIYQSSSNKTTFSNLCFNEFSQTSWSLLPFSRLSLLKYRFGLRQAGSSIGFVGSLHICLSSPLSFVLLNTNWQILHRIFSPSPVNSNNLVTCNGSFFFEVLGLLNSCSGLLSNSKSSVKVAKFQKISSYVQKLKK